MSAVDVKASRLTVSDAMRLRLRALASGATPGAWTAVRLDGEAYAVLDGGSWDRATAQIVPLAGRPNAEFIAAANPAVIHALLDEIERLEKLAYPLIVVEPTR